MRIAAIINHLGHYHKARFSEFVRLCPEISLHVISASGHGAFAEFSADLGREMPFKHYVLLPNQATYGTAVGLRLLRERLTTTLEHVNPTALAVSGWAAPESMTGIGWANERGKALVLFSESQISDAPRNRFREWIKSQVIANVGAALVGGTDHRDYMVSLGFPQDRVFLGYDAIDNLYFKNNSIAARMNEDNLRRTFYLPKHYILASARFVPKKNMFGLINAYALYASRASDPYRLVVLGDGPERGRLESLSRDLGVQNLVSLPGFRGYESLPIYYGLAEAFAHVSITEQWGLVVNEAMASGVPVVVSRRCGCAASLVQNDVNGILVDPGDCCSIARAFERVQADPVISAEWGRQSQAIISKWGTERFAEGLMSAVTTALKNNKSSRNSSMQRALLRFVAAQNPKAVP